MKSTCLVLINTQRSEKCVERTVLYGNITPNTPNGTFRAFDDVRVFGRLDVLFIHIAVVITKYICDVVIGIDPSVKRNLLYIYIIEQKKRDLQQ